MTAQLQQAVNDYNVVNITGGTYIISDTITIPPRRTLTGGTFKIVGQPSGSITESDPEYWNAFEFAGGHDVIIRDMTFIGENDPFDGQYVENLQTVLWFPNGNRYRNIVIQNCNFRNLYGFPLAGSVACESCVIADNTATECGNGFNINAPYAHYLRNTLIDAEAIECSGDYALIADNTLIGSGISVAGRTTPGAYVPGIAVRNNTIDGIRTGIIAKEMAQNAVIENNLISNCRHGIVVAASWSGTWTEDVTVRNNTISDITQVDGVGGDGILIRLDARNTVFDGNTITNTRIAANIQASTTTLKNNYLRGSSVDLFIDANAEDTVLMDNDYQTCNGCS